MQRCGGQLVAASANACTESSACPDRFYCAAEADATTAGCASCPMACRRRAAVDRCRVRLTHLDTWTPWNLGTQLSHSVAHSTDSPTQLADPTSTLTQPSSELTRRLN